MHQVKKYYHADLLCKQYCHYCHARQLFFSAFNHVTHCLKVDKARDQIPPCS